MFPFIQVTVPHHYTLRILAHISSFLSIFVVQGSISSHTRTRVIWTAVTSMYVYSIKLASRTKRKEGMRPGDKRESVFSKIQMC